MRCQRARPSVERVAAQTPKLVVSLVMGEHVTCVQAMGDDAVMILKIYKRKKKKNKKQTKKKNKTKEEEKMISSMALE